MALGKIASPRSLGKAAAEALKKLEQDSRKTSESSVRELCAAANRELKYLTEILTSGKFVPASLRLQRSQARSGMAYWVLRKRSRRSWGA